VSQTEGKQQAVELAVARLAEVDLETRCAALGLAPPGPDGAVRLTAFGAELTLAPPQWQAHRETAIVGGEAAIQTDRLLALHYLLCPSFMPPDRPESEPGETLTSFRELPGGAFYYPPFRGRTAMRLLGACRGDLDWLRSRLDRLDWRPAPYGDLAARIHCLGRLYLTLVYHRGDEEFPDNAEFLFDPAVQLAYSAEDAAALAGRVCEILVRDQG
jgi:hypothetical protein